MKYHVIVILFMFFTLANAAQQSEQSLSALQTAHFEIIHDVNSKEALEVAYLLEFAYQHFNFFYTNNGFQLHVPAEKLKWYCFADTHTFSIHAFNADNMNPNWLTSYYSATTNAVAIVKPGKMQLLKPDKKNLSESALAGVYIMPSVSDSENELPKILHEAAHQLAFNTGLQRQKVMYPVWVSEGLASNFENCIPSASDGMRQQRLIKMYCEHRLIPLNEFILITRMPDNASQRKDIYAQSAVFFKFLSEKYAENLRKYFSHVYNLRTGWRSRAALHTEFVGAFGLIKDVDASWQNYLQALSQQ